MWSPISFKQPFRSRYFLDSFVSHEQGLIAWEYNVLLWKASVCSINHLHTQQGLSNSAIAVLQPMILQTIFFFVFLHMLDNSNKSSSFKNTRYTNFSSNSYQNKILGGNYCSLIVLVCEIKGKSLRFSIAFIAHAVCVHILWAMLWETKKIVTENTLAER